MIERKHLTNDFITKIAGGIEAMPPKPTSRREIELLISGIETQIRAAQERGCTYTEIAKQITDNGYPIKASTLRLAMLRHKKAPAPSHTPRTKQASRPTRSATNKLAGSPPMASNPRMTVSAAQIAD
jgi:hypothetical protein